MGWLWSDSTSKPTPPLTTAAQNPPSPSTPTTAESAPKPLSRDELAERELQSFLQELSADVQPSSTKYNRLPRQPPPPSHTTQTASSFSPSNQNGSTDPESLSEALLPREMSCRDAFDRAFYCQSLGGQFNNLYRYGTVRSCSENWGDFWFCMRVRTMGDTEKEKRIKEHYRERERRRYGRGEGVVRVEDGKVVDLGKDGEKVPRSSEDIWKSRDRKVESGTAFKEPIPVWEGSDEEWQRMERDRRARKINGTP